MKNFVGLLILIASMTQVNAQKSFYDLSAKDINGNDVSFSEFKGKKVLVVNTASKCGFTKQYEGLQELYEKYGGDDFIIVGFPANNFANQEPGSDEEIAQFCSLNYGVTFPMMSKIKVKGKDIHPVYKWLTSKKENGEMDSKVKWNFQKYMIDEDGKLDAYFSPKTKPSSDEVIAWITK